MRILFLLSLLALPGLTNAQGTGLDSSFASNGIYSDSVYFSPGRVLVQIQSDQKILLAHTQIHPVTLRNVSVFRRLLTDGTPDSSFAANGELKLTYGSYEEIIGLREAANGKIVAVLAPRTYQDSRYSIIRLNGNGSMDSSFNDSGVVHRNIGIVIKFNDMELQADGKIIITGRSVAPFYGYFSILRHLENGPLDSAFGNTGVLALPIMQQSVMGEALAVQPDGKILVSGVTTKPATSQHQVTVARATTNGIDGSFGNGYGYVSFDRPGLFRCNVSSMVVQPDGKILLSGTISYKYEGAKHAWIARLQADGNFDSSFQGYGYFQTDSLPYNSYFIAPRLALQADGKILMSYGTSDTPYVYQVLRRFNSDGLPDNSFFYGGHIFSPWPLRSNFPSDIALQPDGKIVVAGYLQNSGLQLVGPYVARYWPNLQFTGIAHPEDAIAFNIFPNPTTDALQIQSELQQAAKVQYELYSITGALLNKSALVQKPAGSYTHTFFLPPDIPQGMYLFVFCVDAKKYIRKIIVGK